MGESEFLKEGPAVFGGVEPEVVIPDLKTLTRRGSLEFSQGVEKVGVAGLSGPANARVGLFVKVVIAAGDDFQCTSPNVDFTAWQSSEIGIGRPLGFTEFSAAYLQRNCPSSIKNLFCHLSLTHGQIPLQRLPFFSKYPEKSGARPSSMGVEGIFVEGNALPKLVVFIDNSVSFES